MNMKHRCILFVAAIMVAIGSFAQTDLSDAFGKTDGVTAINLSKELLQLVPKESLTDGNPEMAALYDKLESIQILIAENPAIGSNLMSDASKLLKKDGYNEALQKKDGDDAGVVYYRSYSSGIMSMVTIAQSEESTFVCMLNGSFTLADMETLGIQNLKK